MFNSVGVIYMIYVCVLEFVFASDVGLLCNMFSYGCLCFVWNSGWFSCLIYVCLIDLVWCGIVFIWLDLIGGYVSYWLVWLATGCWFLRLGVLW